MTGVPPDVESEQRQPTRLQEQSQLSGRRDWRVNARPAIRTSTQASAEARTLEASVMFAKSCRSMTSLARRAETDVTSSVENSAKAKADSDKPSSRIARKRPIGAVSQGRVEEKTLVASLRNQAAAETKQAPQMTGKAPSLFVPISPLTPGLCSAPRSVDILNPSSVGTRDRWSRFEAGNAQAKKMGPEGFSACHVARRSFGQSADTLHLKSRSWAGDPR